MAVYSLWVLSTIRDFGQPANAGKRKSVSNNGGEPSSRVEEGLNSKVGSSVAGRGPFCLPDCNAVRAENRERRVIHQKQFESKIRNASSEGCNLN